MTKVKKAKTGKGARITAIAPRPAITLPSRSLSSAGRIKGSKKPWRQPSSVQDLASQVNAVATLLLNGKIDLKTAEVYSSLGRTVAQNMSMEVARARALKTIPVLELRNDQFA